MKRKILDIQDVFEFVKTSLKRRNIPPTVRETAKYFKISKSAAHLYLRRLYQKKLIKIRKSQQSNKTVARGIILKTQNKWTNVHK